MTELLREFREFRTEIRASIAELRQELRDALHGKPENEYTGLLVRVDRLERTEAVRKWIIRTLTVCIVSLIGRMVWSYFVK